MDLGRYLNLLETILGDIKEDHRDHRRKAVFHMLFTWKFTYKDQATLNVLCEALIKAGRGDLSDNMLKLVEK